LFTINIIINLIKNPLKLIRDLTHKIARAHFLGALYVCAADILSMMMLHNKH